MKSQLTTLNVKDVCELQKQCDVLLLKVDNLNAENNELEKLVALLQNDTVVTFADGRYTDEIREVIMELVSLNVSINKVNDVIEVVLHTLSKKDVSKLRLPSDGCRKRIMEEARLIAQMQVAEAMLQDGDGVIGNCLHGDGTSKYHKHYQNFQITTKDKKTLSFGLSEIAGADAASVLKEFVWVTDEICYALSDKSVKDVTFAKLLESIKTTMSDQGPINPVFNAQLKILRESVLPTAIENWETLDCEQKQELKEMSNYFCKLHLLANFATETGRYLKEFEQLMLHENFETNFAFTSKKECGAFRLSRTSCKAYYQRGSDECGVAHYFNSLLDSRHENPYLESYIGNRFNIVFYDAAALYFHKEAITEFFHAWPNKNNLLEAVNEDISNKLYLAEVRALGIADKIVTGPFWRIVENVDNMFWKLTLT